MNWKAANEQRQDALLRVFYMLVVRVLLTIRPELVSRGAFAPLPIDCAPPQDATPVENHPASTSLADLRQTVFMLLYAARAVFRQLVDSAREAYELMKQAHALAQGLVHPSREAAHQCDPARQRLDTS